MLHADAHTDSLYHLNLAGPFSEHFIECHLLGFLRTKSSMVLR